MACIKSGKSYPFLYEHKDRINDNDAMEIAVAMAKAEREEDTALFMGLIKEQKLKHLPLYGYIYQLTGNEAKANETFAQALKEKSDPGAYDLTGRIALAKYLGSTNGDPKLLKKYYEKIGKDYKKLDIEDALWIVDNLKSINKANDAEKILKHLEKNSNDFHVQMGLIEYLMNNGEKEKAKSLCSKAYSNIDLDNDKLVSKLWDLKEQFEGKDIAIQSAKDLYSTMLSDGSSNTYSKSFNWLESYLSDNKQGEYIQQQAKLHLENNIDKIREIADNRSTDGAILGQLYLLVDNYDGDKFDKDIIKTTIVRNLGYQPGSDYAKMFSILYKYKDQLGDQISDIITSTHDSRSYYEGDKAIFKRDYEAIAYLYASKMSEELKWLTPLLEKYNPTPDEKAQTLFNYVAQLNGEIIKFKVGDFSYTRRSGSYMAKYEGNAASVTFPTQVTYQGKKYDVTIVEGAEGNKTITSAIIPEGITAIESFAFRNCPKLSTIKLPPKGHVEIGVHAFAKDPALSSITNLNYIFYEPGYNVAMRTFLKICYNSPKMIDQFVNQMMREYNTEDMVIFVKHYLFKDSYMDNFDIGNYSATRVIGKKILLACVAKGDNFAMFEVCNAYLGGHEVITPAEYLKCAKLLINKDKASYYYFMGMAYEEGIGVKANRSQALSFYSKGMRMNDKECTQRWWRLR